MKSFSYVFTLNNPTIDIHQFIEVLRGARANSAICQLEKGELGTTHIQGFCTFPNARSFNAIKKLFPTAHVEKAKSGFDSWNYCSKEDTRVEGPVHFGEMPKPRKQKNVTYTEYNQQVIANLEQMVADGRVNIKEYSKLKQSSQLYKLHTNVPTTLDGLRNEWHWGPTGTGKSRHCRETYPEAFIKMPNKWWDGYADQAVVLIEDLQTEHSCLGYHLKIWGDHYPYPAEIKGTTTKIRPSQIIITSNYHPRDIWTDPSVLEPILRRFQIHEHNRLNY